MNEKGQELGCTNTHFTNPHGLHNENHYSSARDMITITQYAMSLPLFYRDHRNHHLQLLPPAGPGGHPPANTTNRMLTNYASDGGSYYYPYATGIKTGSHDQAGYCIVASATYEGYTYIVCCLGCPSVDSGCPRGNAGCGLPVPMGLFKSFQQDHCRPGEVLADVPLEYAWKQDTLQLVAGENVSVILPDSVDSSSIIVETDKPESVKAPIEKGGSRWAPPP